MAIRCPSPARYDTESNIGRPYNTPRFSAAFRLAISWTPESPDSAPIGLTTCCESESVTAAIDGRVFATIDREVNDRGLHVQG